MSFLKTMALGLILPAIFGTIFAMSYVVYLIVRYAPWIGWPVVVIAVIYALGKMMEDAGYE